MTKRSDDMSADEVQRGNADWWTRNTMSYDWTDAVQQPRFSIEWFREVDERFIHGARLYATDKTPFDRIIPFSRLAGKRVLEIGCGMGLHTELMTRAGARVTAIDLSPTSIEATRRRLALKSLDADVRQEDAENLPFKADSFDFVWSWGVIHHSARTAKIVREIGRTLGPDGETRVMVYNRLGMAARVALARSYILKGGFLRHSFDEILYRSTDGFSARHYVAEQFEDLFRAFFLEVDSVICGQDADVVPFPRAVRAKVLHFMSESTLMRLQARLGSFIFLTARRPF